VAPPGLGQDLVGGDGEICLVEVGGSVALWAGYAMLTRSQNHRLFAHSDPSSNGLERNSATKGLPTCDAGDGGGDLFGAAQSEAPSNGRFGSTRTHMVRVHLQGGGGDVNFGGVM